VLRRLIIAALTLALILGTTEGQGGQAVAEATRPNLSYAGAQEKANGEWRWDQCRYRHLEDGWGWSYHEIALTIRCATQHWPVDGGFEKALSVATCESGLNERAYNPNGHAGVYQQSVTYWPGRLAYYALRWWRLRPSVFNGRSNVVVSIRMAHDHGWYRDWSCA